MPVKQSARRHTATIRYALTIVMEQEFSVRVEFHRDPTVESYRIAWERRVAGLLSQLAGTPVRGSHVVSVAFAPGVWEVTRLHEAKGK